MRVFSWIVVLLVLLSACSREVQPMPDKTPAPLPATKTPAPTIAATATVEPTAAPTAAPPVPISPTPDSMNPSVAPERIPSTGPEQTFPMRAAFYYPWYPQAWDQSGLNPFTHFHPTFGYYSSDDPAVIRRHVAAMQYAKIQVGISSWWNPQHHTDTRIATLLKAGEEANFHWALYIESEGQGDPTPEAIRSDLTYIRDHYSDSPAYQKVDGHFLVFVYADPKDRCGMAKRWKEANTVGAYVVLKVFEGFRACPDQPDGWHQYSPAYPQEQQDLYSYTISPGFWKANEGKPRLERNLGQWQASIRAMLASGAKFQLVSTFNEWGEGTSVEDAREWASPSGYGYYLDALHYDGDIPLSLFPYKQNLPAVIRRQIGDWFGTSFQGGHGFNKVASLLSGFGVAASAQQTQLPQSLFSPLPACGARAGRGWGKVLVTVFHKALYFVKDLSRGSLASLKGDGKVIIHPGTTLFTVGEQKLPDSQTVFNQASGLLKSILEPGGFQ